jgi:hypothetical protein
MSNFIHLDSTYRDRQQYPNPASFRVNSKDLGGWASQARTVRALPANVPAPLEFATSVRPLELTIPYNQAFIALPYLYVDFHTKTYDDQNLTYSINQTLRETRFVFTTPSIQYDGLGVPIWIRWFCSMEQVMRFKRNDDVIFKVTSDGSTPLTNLDTLIPNPIDLTKQIKCTWCITPYIRDGDYTNQLAGIVSL